MEDNHSLPACESTCAPIQCQTNPPRRILVVDDDISIRQIDSVVLMQSGYQVDVAEDGAAAWEALNTGRYDLLITDHKMPKVTGVELLKKLHGARMAVPVIMATGSPPHDEFAQCPWLQPATTLLKPYPIEKLLVAVKEVLHAADRTTGGSQPKSQCAQ